MLLLLLNRPCQRETKLCWIKFYLFFGISPCWSILFLNTSKRSITVKIILWWLYRSPCRLSLWIVFFFILYLGVRKNPSNFWFREFTNGKHRWNRCCLNCVKAWILVGAAKVISSHVVTHDHGNSRVSFNVPKFCADWMLVS